MNHREQMQKDAEQWQEKSVKLIRGIRYGVLILGLLVVMVLFLWNLGFPKEVNETLQALVITEDGQTMECTLEIRGQITHYPFNQDKYGMDDSVTVYANGNRILLVSFNGDNSTGYIFTQNQNALCIMTVQRDALILETNLQTVFPELKNQRCLVYYGYDSFDLPGEYAEKFSFLKTE